MSQDRRTLSEYLLEQSDNDDARFPTGWRLGNYEKCMQLTTNISAFVQAFLESKESFSGLPNLSYQRYWRASAPISATNLIGR